MKTLYEIERLIIGVGLEYGDSVNIEHQGITRVYAKTDSHTGQRLMLHLWSDNQGGEQFWIMELRTYVSLDPGNMCMHPIASLCIADITEETVGRLASYMTLLQAAAANIKNNMQ